MYQLSTTKSVSLIVVSIVVALSISLPSFAQEPTQDNRPGMVPQSGAGADAPSLNERAQDRITNLERNLYGRMAAAVDRFKQIEQRLERRVAYLTSIGVDTAELEENLTQVKINLAHILPGEAELMGLGQGRVSYIRTIATSPDPKGTWVNAKEEYMVMIDSLQSIKMSLKNIVADLRTLQATVEDTGQSDVPLFGEDTEGTTTIETGPDVDDMPSAEENPEVSVN